MGLEGIVIETDGYCQCCTHVAKRVMDIENPVEMYFLFLPCENKPMHQFIICRLISSKDFVVGQKLE